MYFNSPLEHLYVHIYMHTNVYVCVCERSIWPSSKIKEYKHLCAKHSCNFVHYVYIQAFPLKTMYMLTMIPP